jgi:K+-sensing histidine kinase KdpD
MRRGAHTEERNDGHAGRRVSSFPQSSRRVTMSGLAERPTSWMKRALARSNESSHRIHSPILGYGLSIVCVAIAVGLSLALQYYQFRDVELPVLTLAVALVTWYAGIGPSVLAVVLGTMSFNYFFTEPLYSFRVSARDFPFFLVFLVWAVVVASFSAVRRQVEHNLRQREEDISRLNRELQKRAVELEASNKELESFAYSVSHDLRAPLRHVAGYSELLQKQAPDSLDEKSRRYIQTILESAKRMGNLIDDLLGFSRLGRAEAKMRAVDLQQVVKEVIAEVSRDTRNRDIAWKIGALPACHGDSSMLKLVVVNLVSNAVKFTRMRTRTEIEIGCVHKNNDELEVFVRDNGAGFDMQYADKLFGVFQRLHLAEQFEGTGIGLATVQRIIHRHGGQVRAEGAVDQGATFYFSLPKAHELAERTASTS